MFLRPAEEIQDANKLWNLVKEPARFKTDKSKTRMAYTKILKVVASQAGADIPVKANRRPEVILVAKFISNMEPAYRNSEGDYITLSRIREEIDLSKEDLEYLCERYEELVKPYISVSTKTEVVLFKLRVQTTMTKAKLLRAAMMHLLTGSEVLESPMDYHFIKLQSMMIDDFKLRYARLVGLALATEYPTVQAMLEDLSLKLIDQTETVEYSGQVVFYDGTIRTENL